MPIVDFKQRGDDRLKALLADSNISDKNKEALKEFLSGWKVRKGDRSGLPVSQARRDIFFSHIGHLIKNLDDIKTDMNDRKKIEELFDKLSKKLNIAQYATVIACSLSFARKLNDGQKPDGFKNVVNISTKQQRRKLTKKDMILWEESTKMIEATNSVQLKALIKTQHDAGLRPSEFYDLNFGDIEKEGKYLVAKVKGKTGERDVILWKCVPFLQRWLQMHPTKKATDPLWIMEEPAQSKKYKAGDIVRYDYWAMVKRVRTLAQKVGINKPMDFYNWRHSSAYMKKKENWPLDLAAKNMGHGVDYFVGVYGRLDISDSTQRLDKVHGMETEKDKDKQENPIQCITCDFTNEPGKTVCEKCGSPLSLKIALEQQDKIKVQQQEQLLELVEKLVDARLKSLSKK